MSELSRKRPHTDDGDITVAKKRVLTGTNGTPHVNGHSDQTEDEQLFQADLEKFRKEAIYRRMKHYHRENERNLAKIEELERRKSTCEAGLAAMSACWSQLIDTIRLFVKTDDLTSNCIQAKDVYDVAAHVEEESFQDLRQAFGKTANATEALVNKLIESGPSEQSLALKGSHLSELQQSQTECAALRSQLGLLTKQLDACTEEKDKYHASLVAAENRAERSQSLTVRAVYTKQSSKSNNSQKEGEATTTEDTERKPSSPSIPSTASTPGPDASRVGTRIDLLPPESVKFWENKISDLEREVFGLRRELAERPPAEVHQPPPQYQHDLEKMKKLNNTAKMEVEKAQEELQQLWLSREEWQKSVLVSQEQMVEGLKSMLSKRDAENTRLREQRDQANAELLERRQKDAFKWSAMQEQKQLSAAHADRITVLQSELARCKARLAAEERNGDLLHFFMEGKPNELELIEELRKQKQVALIRAVAAEGSLAELLKDQPDRDRILKALTEAEEKVLRFSAELDELKKVFGESCTVPPDMSKLTEQIRLQGEEIERLRLHHTRQEKAEGALYVELGGLSAAWEALDKQVKSKVFDLHHMEDKLSKSIVEKAKSENKYYAAMREREASEAEKKALVRSHERQGMMLESMQKLKVGMAKEVEALKQELQQERKKGREAIARLMDAEKTEVELREKLLEQKTFCANHTSGTSRLHEDLLARQGVLRLKEEGWMRHKRELDEQIQHLKQEAATRAVHTHSNKDDSEYQHMRSLLMCSTCESNFRAVIITKCMHTFCKPCIDARISTRQRKCPACNVQFAQSDVSTLYMQ